MDTLLSPANDPPILVADTKRLTEEIGWVPIRISVEMPGKKWQKEVNWWDGPITRDNWDGTGSEVYRLRSW